jgi:diacylglycerol kinase family enzyme
MDRSLPWLVVVNPAAANGRIQRQWARWELRLRELLPRAQFIDTRPAGGLTATIRRAQAEGLGGVLALGGDGTAHLVVNAIMEVQAATGATILFALLPLGTGNDWIKTHGIPRSWSAWRKMFLAGKMRWQNVGLLSYQDDSGEVARRYFINVAGLAYDAFVVRELAQQSRGKGGKLRYFWATFRCLFQYEPEEARISWPGGQASAACYTINVGVCRYSGGGMQFVPQADPRGEQLALTYVERISRLGVLLNSWRFYRGWVAGLPEAHLRSAAEVRIESAVQAPILLEADGEFLGETPVTVSLVRESLWFVGG